MVVYDGSDHSQRTPQGALFKKAFVWCGHLISNVGAERARPRKQVLLEAIKHEAGLVENHEHT
jgi:hypothetical protein